MEIVDEIYNGQPARMLYVDGVGQSGRYLNNFNPLPEYNEFFMDLVDNLHPRSLLVIGGGTYCFPALVKRKYPETSVYVVEPESKMDLLSNKFYGHAGLHIYHTTGEEFLKVPRKYDLIIIDAFNGEKIPSKIRHYTFFRELRTHTETWAMNCYKTKLKVEGTDLITKGENYIIYNSSQR